MKRRSVFAWPLGLALFVPSQAESQQDLALVGQGAEVYATSCGRCHNVRSAAERTDLEWVPIIAHMRARANMAKSEAIAVLAFLQATNVPEAGPSPASTPGSGTAVPNVVIPTTTGSPRKAPPPRRNRR